MSKPPRDSVSPLKKTSVRVYSRSLGATDVGQTLDEANTGLYVAKRNNWYQIVDAIRWNDAASHRRSGLHLR